LGSDDLQGYANEILQSLAPVLNEMPNRLSIEGHTDARPFDREERSNWELSAERANSARRSLAEYGYHPDKFLQVIDLLDGPMGASGQGAGGIDTPEAGTPTDPDTSP
jgi:chemotaxis protein MotB